MNVTFSKPSDISTNILDRDFLRIEFLMPEQIVDAETYQYIGLTEEELVTSVEIVTQYTQEELDDFLSFQEKMMKVSAGISVLILFGYIAANKSISALFKLV